MRFLLNWHYIDREFKLLDIAYIITIIPLLLIIKLPMLIFLLVTIVLVLKDTTLSTKGLTTLGFFGLLMLFLSLFGELNFTGLSRLKIFVEAIIYILLIAISLQRLTKHINFYQIISPMLLLALSLFFFDSIVMMLYVIFEIFALLWLILLYRMDSSIKDSLKVAGIMFALSLPWVVLLFLFFPRISFSHANYGFRDDGIVRVGYNGLMSADDKSIGILSNRVVLEAYFPKGLPPASSLYFRGSVLYQKIGTLWKPMPIYFKREFKPTRVVSMTRLDYAKDIIDYTVTLYPTHKRWIYLLDLPLKAPMNGYIDSDFSVTFKGGVRDKLHYEATSTLKYKYGKETKRFTLNQATIYDKSMAPKTYQKAQEILKEYNSPKERLKAIEEFFKSQRLKYSLTPKGLQKRNITDSFLFVAKEGYCVHFADSFALMCRYAKIPSRIVTGYRGDISNSIKNYIAIKERDAHAWVEVFIDKSWIRIDPSSFASDIDRVTLSRINSNSNTITKDEVSTDRLNLYLLYIKYRIEEWILHYDYLRQLQLIDSFRKSPKFTIIFISIFLTLVLLSIIIYLYLKRDRCRGRGVCELSNILKELKREGFILKEGESISSLFERYVNSLDDEVKRQKIREIDRLYHLCRYAEDDEACRKLQKFS